jgi:hypothetical protein
MTGSFDSGTPQATATASSAGAQGSQDQSYKKLILPITLSAVATWLILVFVVWRVLKRRKRRCETNDAKIYSEKPPVPSKDKRKWSTMPRIELSGKLNSSQYPFPRHCSEHFPYQLPIWGRSNFNSRNEIQTMRDITDRK